jgi:lipopolysaccharide/colanic/teichoic acid biosynthesis glycosyltransferase
MRNTLLERAERQQQRLLPALLHDQALTIADIPWADELSLQRQLKRIADLMVPLPLFLATLPLIALAGLLIRLEDRGPALYMQPRSGLMGRSFRVFKLRTMRVADPQAPQGPLEVCPSRSRRPPISALLCAGTAFHRVGLATPEPLCCN